MKTSYSDLTTSVKKNAMKVGLFYDVSGAFELISVSVKRSLDMELINLYQPTVEKTTGVEMSRS